MRDKIWVSVIGASEVAPEEYKRAMYVGRMLAERNVVIITGGLGGVMEAVSRGAKEVGGFTVGILPTGDRHHANPWIDLPIPTSLGEMRNYLVVSAGDLIVALFGGYGTLSELAYAMKMGKPIIAYKSWRETLSSYDRGQYLSDFDEFTHRLDEALGQLKGG